VGYFRTLEVVLNGRDKDLGKIFWFGISKKAGKLLLMTFASSSACYFFYEVKVLPKDLLPVLLVIYSMRSRFFHKDLLPVLLVIYSMRSRFFQRNCFQFCLLFIL
jgi:hypothetical protein